MKVQWTTSELKETLLISQAVVWGIILLLPGNSFAPSSRVDVLSQYVDDTILGAVIILINLPLIFVNRYKYRRYRRFVHVADWTFWLGITYVVVYRSSQNGLQATDLLIALPFLTLALLHGVIYAGLEERK